jgi:uncharacterized protein (DUF58 family)
MLRRRLTVEGWYYLVVMAFLLAGALLREMNLMLVIFGLMSGPMLFSFWLVGRALKRVDVRRAAPPAIHAGDKLVVEIEAVNHKRSLVWALVVQDRVRRVADLDTETCKASVAFPRLSPGNPQTAIYEGLLRQRGHYELGPLTLSTRFPLGLVYKSALVPQTTKLVVYPKLGKLTQAWKRRQQQLDFGNRPVRSRLGLLEGEVHALREYQTGDSQRWVHWRTTARKGELMVKQFEQQRHRDLALFLELWQPADADFAQRENVELAVSFAATLVAEHCRQGSGRLMLGIAGDKLRLVQGQASTGLLREAWEALALAEPCADDQLPQLFEQGLAEWQQRAVLISVGTRNVDLGDSQRFGAVWGKGPMDLWAARACCVSSADDELDQWFRVTGEREVS